MQFGLCISPGGCQHPCTGAGVPAGNRSGMETMQGCPGVHGRSLPTATRANLRHWWEHTGTTARCFIPGVPIAHSSRLTEKTPAVAMECTSGVPAHVCWPQGDGHVRTRTAAGKRIPAGATSPAAMAARGQVTGARGRAARGRAGPRLICRCLKQEPGTPMVLLG